jgi:hypothetical protein
MSGGVDSSVTAKLLAEKVCESIFFRTLLPTNIQRIMTSPPSLCGIGIPGTNRAQMWAVSGRRTGTMSNACAENSTSHTEWCVNFTTSIHSLLTPRRMLRSTCQETIGSEYLSLRSEHGRRATHRTPMSAAMRMHNLDRVVPHRRADSHLFSLVR